MLFRFLLAALVAGGGPALAASGDQHDSPHVRLETGTSADLLCEALPGGSTGLAGVVCSRVLDRTTGAVGAYREALTVATINTLPALARTPRGAVVLTVNGIPYSSADASPAFAAAGTALTWSAAQAGTDVMPGDVVTATYSF